MNSLHILGGSGHGKVVAEIASLLGYKQIVFVDAVWPERTENGRWPVVGKPTHDHQPMFCAVGRNDVRAELFEEFDLWDSPTLVHPSAIISPSAKIGAGSLVVAGSVINADARVGCGSILNTGCSVDHDCLLEDFVHISPGARLAGGVEVGAGSWIGIGAVVREGVRIGRNVMVAAGAAVVQDVPDAARIGGVPAKGL
ncbi:acetyltransferase [Roseivivax lentus]|nr:acetyltransferase [Roseivivax lentus]